MKTTFKSDEIAHAWFHQSAPYGKSPGAMSFDGPLFKSYSTGIARLIEHKGKRAVVINDHHFSRSTSKHQGCMRYAIPEGTPEFYISQDYGARLDVKPVELFEYAVGQSADCLALGEAGAWLERARQVAEFFGLRRKVDEKAVARLSAAKVRAENRERLAREKRDAAIMAKQQADYDAWKAGAEVHCHFSRFPVAFRVEGDELVSTLGARVPVKDAKRALRFVKSRKGQEWRENGETCPVGNYRVNSVNGAGVIAGCHRIDWSEVERVETLLA